MNEIGTSTGALLAFAWISTAFLALVEGLYLARSGRREEARQDAARDRVRRHATRLQRRVREDPGSILLEASERGAILKYLTSLIPNRRPVDLWLYRAGAPMQLELFVGLTLFFGFTAFMLATLISGSFGIGSIFALFGALPWLYVGRLKRKRMLAFETEFPNAIDLMCRSLKAGHPLQAAMELMAEESEDPVSTEVSQVVDEVSMGLDMRIALENLRERLGTQDTTYLVNAILIQRETGGDLPRVLAALSKQTRDRINFQTKVGALVAQTSMSANVLAVFPLFFAGAISLAIPGYLTPMISSEGGRQVLGVAVGLTLTGWFLCRRIAVVKV